MNDISRFMDENGKINTWVAKKELKYEILKYISTKFDNSTIPIYNGRKYWYNLAICVEGRV